MRRNPIEADTLDPPSDKVKLGLGISLILHALLFVLVMFGPDFFQGAKPKPLELVTIQLVGSLEPPAPAAPKAPVNPNLAGPDVVRLPTADPVVPQPTPIEKITIPESPVEIIPIAKTPPKETPVVTKAKDPPPKVKAPEKPPEKAPEPKPKPKPKPKAPSDQALLDQRLEELQRKKESEAEEDAVNQAIANIALERGRGTGVSSQPAAPNTTGRLVEAERQGYYLQILNIVKSNWIPPANAVASNISSTFVIAIDPSGIVTGKNMLSSSGNPDFDASVEQAINRSKFPPLPSAFNGKPDNPALQFNLNYLTQG
jgi:outer membrane biosynthesis protein TonB